MGAVDAMALEDLVDAAEVWVLTGRAPRPDRWGLELLAAPRSRGLRAL